MGLLRIYIYIYKEKTRKKPASQKKNRRVFPQARIAIVDSLLLRTATLSGKTSSEDLVQFSEDTEITAKFEGQDLLTI
jgi:hypothetical protein